MKTQQITKAQRATAYHEAGHTVMAYIVRRAFRRVSIVEEEDRLGHVLYAKWRADFDPDAVDEDRARRGLEKAIMTAQAGEVAEHIFTKRHNWQGARGDLQLETDLASYLISDMEDELPASLKWLRIRTRNQLLVPFYWRAVEDLAAALLEKKEMSSREARLIIQNSIRSHTKRQLATYLDLRKGQA
jgi:ATP-dependent Zn protease